jgi:hypothetical protein
VQRYSSTVENQQQEGEKGVQNGAKKILSFFVTSVQNRFSTITVAAVSTCGVDVLHGLQ